MVLPLSTRYIPAWWNSLTREFQQVAMKFQTREKVQRNRELDELVILRINIDQDARPGHA